MQPLHYDAALTFTKSLRTSIGRRNIKKEDFLKYLVKYAEKRNIKKITKLRVSDIDYFLELARSPKDDLGNASVSC